MVDDILIPKSELHIAADQLLRLCVVRDIAPVVFSTNKTFTTGYPNTRVRLAVALGYREWDAEEALIRCMFIQSQYRDRVHRVRQDGSATVRSFPSEVAHIAKTIGRRIISYSTPSIFM